MQPGRIVIGAVSAAACLAFAETGLAGPMFMGLGDLPGDAYYSFAADVSADGSTVIGTSLSGGDMFTYEAFRWTEATGMVGIGGLPDSDVESLGFSISGDGSTIVGEAIVGYGVNVLRREAFRWTAGGGVQSLGILPDMTYLDSATDANFDGSTIVGYDYSTTGAEAYRWTKSGGVQFLGHLRGSYIDSYADGVSPDGSVIVGSSASSNGIDPYRREAFRWTESGGMQGLGDLPGGQFYSGASDLSDDGSTIVGIAENELGRVAFRWTEESAMQGLGDIPGGEYGSSASAISADGSIIIGSSKGDLGDEAFIWNEEFGMRRLADILTQDYGLELTGWTLQYANGISADGTTIVGAGLNPNGDFEAFIARIPTPGAAMLFALGGVAVARRRR